MPAPWRVQVIKRCAVAVQQDAQGELALLFLLPDDTAIEVPLSREAAESTGKALIAPRVAMP